MALNLRQETDVRFTTKGSKLTNKELDDTLIGLHDLIDNLETTVQSSAGGTNFGIQQLSANGDWNGESAVIEVDTNGGAVTVTIPTALIVPGNRITILDAGGNAGTDNITIEGQASEKIDGATSKVISSDYGSVTLQCTEETSYTKMVSI